MFNVTEGLKWLTDRRAFAFTGAGGDNDRPEAWQQTIYRVKVADPATLPIVAFDDADLPYGIRVHITHCCKRHGCKYSSHLYCPVREGMFKQQYECEDCGDPEESLIISLEKLVEEFENYEADNAEASLSFEAAQAVTGTYHQVAERIREILGRKI